MQIDVKFKKVHDDAKLPTRNHGNRELSDYEVKWLELENARFEQERPEMYASGYRIGFPFEADDSGEPTSLIIGTGDTGYDVFAVEDKVIPAKGSAIVDIGIEVAYVSPGYWFMVCNRSGLGFKGLRVHPGIIDNGYTGNLGVCMFNFSSNDYKIEKGNKIAQLVFFPIIEPRISWNDEKQKTERGDKGFGSSGR